MLLSLVEICAYKFNPNHSILKYFVNFFFLSSPSTHTSTITLIFTLTYTKRMLNRVMGNRWRLNESSSDHTSAISTHIDLRETILIFRLVMLDKIEFEFWNMNIKIINLLNFKHWKEIYECFFNFNAETIYIIW